MDRNRIPVRIRLESRLVDVAEPGGKSIRCLEGWDMLLDELDCALSVLFPDYRLWTVREKYGVLDFWVDSFDAQDKAKRAEQRETLGGNTVFAWAGDGILMAMKSEHERRLAEARSMIAMFEARSSRTCELCGGPGTVLDDSSWIRVRCSSCS